MKRIATTILMALLLVSCSNDDEENNDPSIVGAFILTALNVDNPEDLNDDGIASPNLLDEAPCLDSSVSFSADGTYNSVTDELNIIVNSDPTGTTTVVECFGPLNETGTYTIEGNVLTINPETPQSDAALSVNSGTFTVTNTTLTIVSITQFGQIEFIYTRQ